LEILLTPDQPANIRQQDMYETIMSATPIKGVKTPDQPGVWQTDLA
jgi:hypothetical protein